MIVGVPKEIKDKENRVALTPAGAEEFVEAGHTLLVEQNAGTGSGFTEEEYVRAGAEIVKTAAEVFERAEMIIKIKEPLEPEFKMLREGQVLFTYLHLAADKGLTDKLLATKCIGIAYETVQKDDGELPLLTPMSEVAGRYATIVGANLLAMHEGGRGILPGGVTGVSPADVVVVGGGIVGENAARMAAGLGARVTILEINTSRMRYLDAVMPDNVRCLMSTKGNMEFALRKADLVIGAVLIPGAAAPKIVKREHLKLMKKGSVIVDVAIDQGGCTECSVPTSHTDPTFVVDEVLHYCVTNMPGAYPRTSTYAITNVTLPYALKLAGKGWKKALQEDRVLLK